MRSKPTELTSRFAAAKVKINLILSDGGEIYFAIWNYLPNFALPLLKMVGKQY
jgi:hypothetical protein